MTPALLIQSRYTLLADSHHEAPHRRQAVASYVIHITLDHLIKHLSQVVKKIYLQSQLIRGFPRDDLVRMKLQVFVRNNISNSLGLVDDLFMQRLVAVSSTIPLDAALHRTLFQLAAVGLPSIFTHLYSFSQIILTYIPSRSLTFTYLPNFDIFLNMVVIPIVLCLVKAQWNSTGMTKFVLSQKTC